MIADLLPTEDQQQIHDSIAGTFARVLPLDRLRDEGSGAAKEEKRHWPSLTEAGIFGLGLDADRGGIGYGLPEEVIIARLAGRHLVSPILLATMIAAHVAAEQGDDDLVARIVGGSAIAAFANPASGGETQAFDSGPAEMLLTWRGERMALHAKSDFAAPYAVGCMDEAIDLQRGTLSDTALAQSAADGRIARRASLLIAAYLVGIAEMARDMSVEYAQVRHQFGQPIGAFQAVKHSCADMALRAEAAQAQTYMAAVDPDPTQVAAARLLARQAARTNAKDNIQVHGGIGFTFEADAHRLLKRGHVMGLLGSSESAEKGIIIPR